MENVYFYAVLGLVFIFLMTTAGSAVACFMGNATIERHSALIGGLSGGIMLASAVWSLLIPAIGGGERENVIGVTVGFAAGTLLFTLLGVVLKEDESGGFVKLFTAMTAHNVPEGLSVGFAFGAASIGKISISAAFGIALGIGIQNFPEGAAISVPARKKYSRIKAFLLGMLSGAVEPIAGAIGLFLSGFAAWIMPVLMSFSAAAMIYTVFSELSGEVSKKPLFGSFGACVGFLIMLLLDVTLG